MRLKVGVIGVGAMGENHVRNYSQLPVELVGIYDFDPERATAIAQKYGTETFPSAKQLLSKVEAVSIAVPTTLHCICTLEALEAGAHVLVEKPIATTLEDAREMNRKALAVGKVLMVGHLERMNPAVQAIKNFVDEGGLGEVVSITAKRVGPHNPRIRDVGVILDLGIHDIDVISYIFGQKAEKVFTLGGQATQYPFEDYALLLLSFPQNKIGVIETNWLTPKKVRTLTVVGTKGVIEVDYPSQRAILLRDPDCSEGMELKVVKEEPLRAELEVFINAVEEGKPAAITAKEAISALEVALASMESLRIGSQCLL